MDLGELECLAVLVGLHPFKHYFSLPAAGVDIETFERSILQRMALDRNLPARVKRLNLQLYTKWISLHPMFENK